MKDISTGELVEAERRAKENDVKICFKQADFCALSDTFTEKFDIVIAMDNALPHMLTSNDLELAIKSIVNQLKENGIFVASIRDYDSLLMEKPPYLPTLQNAIQYNQAGLAEEWLRTYYVKTYGEKSYPEEWICDGLINIPLRLIDDVDNASLQQSENIPLMIRFQNGRFCCQGTREYLNCLKEQHITAYPAYVFVTDKQEYDYYESNYGIHFHRIQFRN